MRTPSNAISVEIVDSGIGIEAEDLERIFLPFDQGDHGQGYGGLGLGLTISRRLVELHGGAIRASSSGRNRGTCLVIELPEGPPKQGAEEISVSDGPDLAEFRPPRRVLLVEDHAPTRSALEGLLTRRGYEVANAQSLREALERMREFDFDLVLSDVGLPDGSGHELMRELRRLRPHCMGIALSGYGMECDIQRSLAAGFFMHLIKPITARALDEALLQATVECSRDAWQSGQSGSPVT